MTPCLFRLAQQSLVLIGTISNDRFLLLFFFCSWVIFCCVYAAHFLYPLIPWCTRWLLLFLGDCEQRRSRHRCAAASLTLVSFPLDLYSEGQPPGHVVVPLLIFKDPPYSFSRAMLIYIQIKQYTIMAPPSLPPSLRSSLPFCDRV